MAGRYPVVLDVKKSQIRDKWQFKVDPLVASWQKHTCGFKPHGKKMSNKWHQSRLAAAEEVVSEGLE